MKNLYHPASKQAMLANSVRLKTYGLLLSIFILLLLSTFTALANGGKGSPTGNSGILRANLYLLDAGNVTTLADGNLTEFDVPYSDLVLLEDAVKFININENFGLLRHGVSLAVERRPALTANDTLYLQLWKTTQRNYRYEFIPSNLSGTNLMGYLEDAYLNTSTPINLFSTTLVDFSVNADVASSATNRFKIVFKPLTPLAVTFASIQAKPLLNGNNSISWQVENESNLLQYEVEKSLDGTRFINAATVAVTGNNNSRSSYQFTDVQVSGIKNYYRIKSTDINGRVKYSSIVNVTSGKATKAITIYPNPVKSSVVNLNFSNSAVGSYKISISNVSGQTVHQQTLEINNGTGTYSLQLKNQLSKGIYYLRVTFPDSTISIQQLLAD